MKFRRISPALALGLLLWYSGRCLAEQECDVTQEQRERYLVLSGKGRIAHEIGHYGEAISAYSEAYYICDSTPILYNLAQAYRLSEAALTDIEAKRKTLRQAITFYENVIRKLAGDSDPRAVALNEKARGFRQDCQKLLEKLPSAESLRMASPEKVPVYKKGWFWGTILGSLGAVGLGVGLGAYYGTRLKDPASDLGTFSAY